MVERKEMQRAIEKTILPALLLLFVACRGGDVKPVDLETGDSCAFCRMAMSGREFAAEIIPTGGEALKFDDIGCSLAYLREHGELRSSVIFVNDFELRKWLPARDAWFVKSESIKTPMGGGIIAFSNREKAEAALTKYSGVISRFDGIYGSSPR